VEAKNTCLTFLCFVFVFWVVVEKQGSETVFFTHPKGGVSAVS
jgi:hypothetical protein